MKLVGVAAGLGLLLLVAGALLDSGTVTIVGIALAVPMGVLGLGVRSFHRVRALRDLARETEEPDGGYW